VDCRKLAGALTGAIVLIAASPVPQPSATPQPISIHVQATQTQQYHGGFAAAYTGPQSLSNLPDEAKTFDATLYLGVRLGGIGEAYIDPEIDQGFGLGQPGVLSGGYAGTVGVAGFVSGEAYKLGSVTPYGRIQRAFFRKTVNISGPLTAVDPDENQLGGSVSAEHLTLTAGKFAVTDIFDDNVYAHDPKNDFLNWSIIDMGAFDYAADAWGYTYGLAAELAGRQSTFRTGLFQLSVVPNQIAIDPQPLHQFSSISELEERTSLFGGHPGAVKVLVYFNDGYLGSYSDAIELGESTGSIPSTALVRNAKHIEAGAGVNVAQEVAPHIGVFARASAVNGTYEADDFSDIDRSISGGISVDGGAFGRPNDTFGLAVAENGLSLPAQQYFAAGGLGILIGDGALSYAPERILETYYKIGLVRGVALSADYQRIEDPAYNAARGPVSVFGLRLHIQE
jgi:high affinity Mn2+ porin